MEYVLFYLAGFASAASGLAIWFYAYVSLLRKERKAIKEQSERLLIESSNLSQQLVDLANRRQQLDESFAFQAKSLANDFESKNRQLEDSFAAKTAKLTTEFENRHKQLEETFSTRTTTQTAEFESKRRQLNEAIAACSARKVQYEELFRENNDLKQDLFNLTIQLRKTERDQAAITARQNRLDQKTNDLASRYLKENVAWNASKLTVNNFSSSKQRLRDVVELCRGIGFDVPQEREEELIKDLKTKFEEIVRAQFAREEQARIRSQIREEERLAREIDKQIQDTERERAAIQAALEKTLLKVKDEHSAEVEALRAKLKEAEERAQRAKSMAEITKAGYVYVISNIGSFGDGVYKIGMTRRLEPLDRVRELGDASVPFAFDVHMMISCDNAPALENALHRELHKQRLNKVNFRKEYFRTDLETIRTIVEANHGVVEYVAEPAALEYRESITMKDEDYQFIDQTLQPLARGEDGGFVED